MECFYFPIRRIVYTDAEGFGLIYQVFVKWAFDIGIRLIAIHVRLTIPGNCPQIPKGFLRFLHHNLPPGEGANP